MMRIIFALVALNIFFAGPVFAQNANDIVAVAGNKQITVKEFNDKYNDFTISADATGAWTDLGVTGVADVQSRLAANGKFQVGLSLSGSDFDIPVLQFHGMVFARANL